MDTQGTFDSNSTVFENAFIFALTLLVSSVTVYNIMHNLQEDNLQHLSFFAEYGVLALMLIIHHHFRYGKEHKINNCI